VGWGGRHRYNRRRDWGKNMKKGLRRKRTKRKGEKGKNRRRFLPVT
jgi:hypothetical protein